MDQDHRIPKYNRLRGGLNAVFVRPTTFKVVEQTTGLAESYMVETGRAEDGDYVFVERVDEDGVLRICLPPKVVNAIIRHRDALSTKARSLKGKEQAKARKDRGELPGFMRARAAV